MKTHLPSFQSRFAFAAFALSCCLAAGAFAAPQNIGLLRYFPDKPYNVVVGVQPAQLTAAPLIADQWDEIYREEAIQRVEKLEKATGVNLLKDVETVILAGNPRQRTQGAALVQGKWNKEKVVQAISAKSEFTEKKLGDKTCYVFSDPKDGLHDAVCFLSDNVAILAHEEFLTRDYKTLGEQSPSLASNAELSALLGDIPASAQAWIAGRVPAELPPALRARPMLAHLKGFCAWISVDKTVQAEARAIFKSADKAAEAGKVLEGAVALARLHAEGAAAAEDAQAAGAAAAAEQARHKALKPVIDKFSWKVDGTTLSGRVELAPDEVRALRELRRERMGKGGFFGWLQRHRAEQAIGNRNEGHL